MISLLSSRDFYQVERVREQLYSRGFDHIVMDFNGADEIALTTADGKFSWWYSCQNLDTVQLVWRSTKFLYRQFGDSECATSACIADDISRMPMKFQTLVGDMGTSLSGGQKQRLLLARALYKRPRILFLDEATSHLDIAREGDINKMVAKLNFTRIIVAHRPETIRSADRILELNQGKIEREFRRENTKSNCSGASQQMG
nr:ATP-binding cassette domain-containing protein [Massilia antarctica]